jgi:ABC-type branched-subunit amino acid transport system substrate-binding protein
MSRIQAGRRSALAAFAVGMTVVLLCAGCASSGNNAPTARSSDTAAVVHIFAWGDDTAPGDNGAPPQTYMKDVPEAAVEAINSNPDSKVKLTLTFCDTTSTPNGTATCAQKALSPTGCNGSPCAVAVDVQSFNENIAVPPLHAAGIPVVAVVPGSEQVIKTPGVFCMDGTDQAAEPGLAYLLKAAGAHKVGIVGFQIPEITVFDQWIEEGLRAQGLTLTGIQNPAEADVNMPPPISAVMGNGADGFIYGGAYIGAALKYVRSTYPKAKIAMPSYITAPASLQGIPVSVTNGVSVASYNQPVTAHVPGAAQYLAEIRGKVAPAFKYYDLSLVTWLSIHFIANVAANISGSINRTSLLKAIEHAKNVNMYGIMPPWSASQLGKDGAAACSPYHVWVPDYLKNNLQVTDEPGVFRTSGTGQVAYVDPGFKAPRG